MSATAFGNISENIRDENIRQPDGEAVLRRAFAQLPEDYRVFYHPQIDALQTVDPYDRTLEFIVTHRQKGMIGISAKFGDISEEQHGLINQYQPRRFFYKILDPARQAQSALRDLLAAGNPEWEDGLPFGVAVFLPETRRREFFDPKNIFFFEEDLCASYFITKLDDMFADMPNRAKAELFARDYVLLCNYLKQHSDLENPFLPEPPPPAPPPMSRQHAKREVRQAIQQAAQEEWAEPETIWPAEAETRPRVEAPWHKSFSIARPARQKKEKPAAHNAARDAAQDKRDSAATATVHAFKRPSKTQSKPKPKLHPQARHDISPLEQMAVEAVAAPVIPEAHYEMAFTARAPYVAPDVPQVQAELVQEETLDLPMQAPPSEAVPAMVGAAAGEYNVAAIVEVGVEQEAAQQAPEQKAPEMQPAAHRKVRRETVQEAVIEPPALLVFFNRLETALHIPSTPNVVLSPTHWLMAIAGAVSVISGSFFIFRNVGILLS